MQAFRTDVPLALLIACSHLFNSKKAFHSHAAKYLAQACCTMRQIMPLDLNARDTSSNCIQAGQNKGGGTVPS